MKLLITLAWKNLSRYSRRTIITASALAVGLGLFILIDSMLLGAGRETELNLIRYDTGVAQIQHKDYLETYENDPLEKAVDNTESILNRLEKEGIPAAPRITFRSEMIVRQDPFKEDGSLMVEAVGINPERDSQVYDIKRHIAEGGRYLKPDEEGVLIGGWLAEDIGAEVGYPITLVTTTKTGYRQTMNLEIVGIVNSPDPVLNRKQVFIPLETANFYMEMGGAVTSITLGLPEHRYPEAEKLAANTKEAIGLDTSKYDIVTWKDQAKDYLAIAQAKQGGTGMILFLVFVIAAVGVTNTMLMAIYERIRELGMMRAIGMTDSQIRFAFLFEAAGIGLIGALVGVLIGAAATFYMVNWGIDFGWMLRDMDVGYRIAGVFRGTWNPAGMLQAFFAGIILATAVSYIPTRKALKMQISNCLRHQ